MRKAHVLDLLARAGERDAADIARRLNASPEAASMLLLRLMRQGLVQREFDEEQGVFFYTLTPKGEARWRYLVQSTDNTGR